MAELSKKYGVHLTQIGSWKRAVIENMAAAFSRRGGDPGKPDVAAIQGKLMKLRLISYIPRLAS